MMWCIDCFHIHLILHKPWFKKPLGQLLGRSTVLLQDISSFCFCLQSWTCWTDTSIYFSCDMTYSLYLSKSRRGQPAYSHWDKNVSSYDEDDCLEQLCIDLLWSFLLMGQVGSVHVSKISPATHWITCFRPQYIGCFFFFPFFFSNPIFLKHSVFAPFKLLAAALRIPGISVSPTFCN